MSMTDDKLQYGVWGASIKNVPTRGEGVTTMGTGGVKVNKDVPFK